MWLIKGSTGIRHQVSGIVATGARQKGWVIDEGDEDNDDCFGLAHAHLAERRYQC